MRVVRLRYRHDVYCRDHNCGARVCEMGDISDAQHPDGDPVDVYSFDFSLPRVFELACPKGHAVEIYAPRDAALQRTPEPEGARRVAPATLRP